MDVPRLSALAATAVLDLLFPPRCAGCRREGPYLCERCLAGLPELPLVVSTSVGGALDAVLAPFPMDGVAREAVHRLKYRGVADEDTTRRSYSPRSSAAAWRFPSTVEGWRGSRAARPRPDRRAARSAGPTSPGPSVRFEASPERGWRSSTTWSPRGRLWMPAPRRSSTRTPGASSGSRSRGRCDPSESPKLDPVVGFARPRPRVTMNYGPQSRGISPEERGHGATDSGAQCGDLR